MPSCPQPRHRRFERADVEPDPARKRRPLTFVVIGGGLVGVELLASLTAFADGIAPLYKHVNRDEVRFILLEGGDRIMPEIDPTLANYGTEVLRKRRGPTSGPGRACRPSSRARLHLGARRSRRIPSSWQRRGSSPQPGGGRLPVEKDRSWPASSSMGPCALKSHRRSGRSAIVRPSRTGRRAYPKPSAARPA